jgi:hypothetical protein
MRTRSVLVGLAATALTLVTAGPAAADPVNHGEIFTLQCNNGVGTLQVAANGNGDWTPGHVIGTTQILLPYEFHITGTFTPTGGTAQTFTDDLAKRTPNHGLLTTCTFSDSGTDPSGTFSFTGTVKARVVG